MTLYGLDCSNHQGSMSDLGGYRVSFFVHKLTEGTTYADPDAARNLAMARRLEVPVLGGYHYLRHGNGAGEADYFADRARALFGHDLRGFLWQLDCEADATEADIAAFKRRWDKGTGAPILFYTGDWWLKPRGWNIASLGFAGLWSAPNHGYVGRANNVHAGDWHAGYGGFDRITILQYDARSSIGDTNEYAGTLAQLKQLIGEDDMDQATFSRYLLGALKDGDVRRQLLDAIVHTDGVIKAPVGQRGNAEWWWQSILDLDYQHTSDLAVAVGALKAQADPASLAAALVPALASAGLGKPVSREDLEAALRSVLGSLDDRAGA